MRTHATLGTPDQEPWSYGVVHESINRAAIELRYQLLPHIYNVLHGVERHRSAGDAAAAPRVSRRPPHLRPDDEFLFGRDLLIAPVLQEAQREREIYLPKGEWFDFWTGRRYESGPGGLVARVRVTLDSTPIFVRGGALCLRQPVVQHTGQMNGKALEVQVFPATSSDGTLYEDDGETMVHAGRLDAPALQSDTNGDDDDARRRRAGRLVSCPRRAISSSRWSRSGEPTRVTSGTATLTRYTPAEPSTHASGWTIALDTGFLVVKQPDTFAAMHVVIER